MNELIEGLKIVVSWDTVDKIMEENLLDTYRTLAEDVKRLSKQKKLPDYAKQDLEQYKTLLAALDVVGAFYVHDFAKKAKKKK